MHRFEYHSPNSLAEAAALLDGFGDRARIIAGGTDLLTALKERWETPDHVIDLRCIPGLDEITYDPGAGLTIGARVTVRAVETSLLVRRYYPALAYAASTLASVQIRNLATLAGNICRASPSADMPPVLLALDASVTAYGHGQRPARAEDGLGQRPARAEDGLGQRPARAEDGLGQRPARAEDGHGQRPARVEGERTIPLDEFFTGPGRTVLARNEVLTAIHLPPVDAFPAGASPNRHFGAAYIKHSPRRAMDLAMVGVAVAVTVEQGWITHVRIALGAVAPTPRRALSAEAVLLGRPVSSELLEAASQAAASECTPISDVRGTASHRRAMVAVLTRRAVEQAIAGMPAEAEARP